jgi:hypothetical protein
MKNLLTKPMMEMNVMEAIGASLLISALAYGIGYGAVMVHDKITSGKKIKGFTEESDTYNVPD